MIQLEVLGKPLALNRPRACSRGNYIHMYDSQVNEKKQVQWQVTAQYKENPLTVPIYVYLEFGMPIPKATSKVKTRLMLENELHHVVKPDLDNLIKFILDCLNGILFDDDSQIHEIHARKKYSQHPGTLIRVLTEHEIVNRKIELEDAIKEKHRMCEIINNL